MTCPLCDDTGWRPLEADGVRRVARCECWRSTVADRLLADANIPPRYRRCDLENFREYNDSLNRAVRAAKRFVEGFPGGVDRGLFLIGHPGVGKTHLGVAVLKHCIREKGARGIFYDTRELLKIIRNTYNPLVQTAEMDILRPVMRADGVCAGDKMAPAKASRTATTRGLIEVGNLLRVYRNRRVLR